MLIFSNTTTSRLQYIAHFLGQYFKISIGITINRDEYNQYKGVKLNYSGNTISSNEIFITPVELLFQKGISPISINCFIHPDGYKAFFKNNSITGFDIFAAIFYLLTRYEEYLPHQKDSYGRYAHQQSVAFKGGFLHQPLINIWLKDFGKLMQQKFPDCQLKTVSFKFIPTYDIDIAWSYKNKGFLRNTGGGLKSILKGQWSSIKERASVVINNKKDPFDSYDWMNELHQQFNLEPIYFFHVGHQRNQYDKNISINNSEFQQLIKTTSNKYQVGLHPSWHSGVEPLFLKKEKEFLEGIIDKEITQSRQHYIRLTIPGTYRQLIAARITNDYTMGYGSINGFRASVAAPFFWYDLEREETTNLLIHPFCYMDATSFYQQKSTTEQALKEMLYYYNEIKGVGGTFISIWHNPFLGEDKLYKGWKEIYLKAMQIISSS